MKGLYPRRARVVKLFARLLGFCNSDISHYVTHYYKLAFTSIRVIGILIVIYSVMSVGYVLLIHPQGYLITNLISPVFYILLGVILFLLSKQIARMAVKGIERE